MKLNRFIKVDFCCDNCKGEFYRDIVFSPAPNLDELGGYSHYCAECAVIVKKRIKKAPIRQQNRRKKTGRTYLIGIRGTKEWVKRVKSIARKEKIKHVEVLEKALECYERHR